MPSNPRYPALTSARTFFELQSHHAVAKDWQMRELFKQDPERFNRLSVEAAGLFLDYSKNRLNAETMRLLFALARECGVEAQREAMFSGEKINSTEGRAVLHTALRAPRATTGSA